MTLARVERPQDALAGSAGADHHREEEENGGGVTTPAPLALPGQYATVRTNPITGELNVLGQTNEGAPRMRRSQRIMRVKEAEFAEIVRLTAALSARFPASRLHAQVRDSSPVHQIHSGLATVDSVAVVNSG
jgi:hypothetical protein